MTTRFKQIKPGEPIFADWANRVGESLDAFAGSMTGGGLQGMSMTGAFLKGKGRIDTLIKQGQLDAPLKADDTADLSWNIYNEEDTAWDDTTDNVEVTGRGVGYLHQRTWLTVWFNGALWVPLGVPLGLHVMGQATATINADASSTDNVTIYYRNSSGTWTVTSPADKITAINESDVTIVSGQRVTCSFGTREKKWSVLPLRCS